MASLLATFVLDDDAMLGIQQRGEAPALFLATLFLLSNTLASIKERLAAHSIALHAEGSEGWSKEVELDKGDLQHAVSLAEASSQAMWGCAHYSLQEPLQIIQVRHFKHVC